MNSSLLAAPMLLGIKWLDPNYLLDHFGGALFWISLAIVFVECGLFFPFLPGDTLLFALGLFIAGRQIEVLGFASRPVELVVAIVLLSVSAVLGNVAGYEIGRKLGPPIYAHDGRILKRKYLDNTQYFFTRHGDKALVIGRFVPFVRTYITVVAGVTRMDRRRFLVWSGVGALLWVIVITLLGYFLGQVSWIGDNLDKATIAIGLFTVVPLFIEALRHAATHDDGDSDHADPADPPDRRSPQIPQIPPTRSRGAPGSRRPGGVQISLPEHRTDVETDVGERVRTFRAAVDGADHDLDGGPGLAQRTGGVADGAAGGDHVLDQGHPATGDVRTLDQLGGAVGLRLLAHEQRRHARRRAQHGRDRDPTELEPPEQLGALGHEVDQSAPRPLPGAPGRTRRGTCRSTPSPAGPSAA